MELKLEVHNSLCSTSTFEINGIKANSDDFGFQCDDAPEDSEEYGCGDMQFHRKPATQDILTKYHIDTDDYNSVCEELGSELSFGSCGMCV